MSTRIDDLEKNIADLMTQAGVEEEDGANKQAAKHWAERLGFSTSAQDDRIIVCHFLAVLYI